MTDLEGLLCYMLEISSRRATDAPWGSFGISLMDFHKKPGNEQLKNKWSLLSGSLLHSTQGSTCIPK